jgi:hypothetical protein
MARARLRDYNQFASRIFIFVLYAENDHSWIRREENRFHVHLRSLSQKTGRLKADLWKTFEHMQSSGWIYNLKLSPHDIYFYVNLPSYLSFSDKALESTSHVPPLFGEGTMLVDPMNPPKLQEILPEIVIEG